MLKNRHDRFCNRVSRLHPRNSTHPFNQIAMENLCETCNRLDKISCCPTQSPCTNYRQRDSGVLMVYIAITFVAAIILMAIYL
jgi:hypothetical protein